MDIFVTTLVLAGVGKPSDRAYDGQDLTPLLRGETTASPHDWFFYYTTCTELNGCPPTNLTGASSLGQALPSDRIAAVREGNGPMKCHFFTHSGQGNEPYVRHDPALCFNVERDPGEKEPLTEKTWDGDKCNAGPHSSCLRDFVEQAYKAVAAKHASTKWCEYCEADGVLGRSMLSATVDWRVMDCRGLNAAESGCCTKAGGRCE